MSGWQLVAAFSFSLSVWIIYLILRNWLIPQPDWRPHRPLPTIIVAAVDSSDETKLKSDLVAAGADDQESFQKALNWLPRGGIVRLTAGDYNFGDPVYVDTSGGSYQIDGVEDGVEIHSGPIPWNVNWWELDEQRPPGGGDSQTS